MTAPLRRARAHARRGVYLGVSLIALCAPVAAALVACTAGDLRYTSTSSEAGADTGVVADGGPLSEGDGALFPLPPVSDGGIVASIRSVACSSLDPDGGCDPTAGSGCCLASSSNPTGSDNTCVDQLQHFGGTACMNAGDVFLACLGSNTDSVCCWQPEGDGRMNTRYRTDCDGGIEACDPLADGGSCSNGAVCTPKTCKGVMIGYCGSGAAPCAD